MASKYNVCIIRPEGFLFSSCFQEMAETVYYGLLGLGYEAKLQENIADSEATNIIFGAHILGPDPQIPEGSILYNWEQIGSYQAPEHYYALAKKYPFWDYSVQNVARWELMGYRVKHVPLGYVSQLGRVPKLKHEDIDVLFYGSMNDRRAAVINNLVDAGLKVEWLDQSFGEERDGFIARSKVMLNVHFYDAKVFEISRIGYLLSNRKAVVTELSEDMMGLENAVAGVSYEKIVETCKDLVYDNSKRRELEKRGSELFSRRSEMDILEGALR